MNTFTIYFILLSSDLLHCRYKHSNIISDWLTAHDSDFSQSGFRLTCNSVGTVNVTENILSIS